MDLMYGLLAVCYIFEGIYTKTHMCAKQNV